TILAIASHHGLESLLGLSKNSVLLVTPLICAGVVMIIKQNRARYYIEHEVDWWTLLFFMLLFAVAGTLEYTHVDLLMANYFAGICGTSMLTLVPFIFVVSAVGSAFVDNVIFVAAFCPVIEQLAVSIKDFPLWWALLFGACFGGNITMIGSTANIVALGMLEKRSSGPHMTFFQWLKVGALSTLISGVIAGGGVLLLSPLMPDRYAPVTFEKISVKTERRFADKNVEIRGTLRADAASLGRPGYFAAALEDRQGRRLALVLPESLRERFTGAVDHEVSLRGKLTSTGDAELEYPHRLEVEDLNP
ncbi:MAG: SLC13 family permease, partial [Victivallaceae bacterium]|nr:SLC13 family permease [Victivallaceae bacterium]